MPLNNTLAQDRPFVTVGQDGLSDYNGTDEVPINAAITSLASTGGIVFIKEGTYTINNPILLNQDRVKLQGAGNSTIIKPADASNLNYAIFVSEDFCIISDIYIQGNKTNQSSGNGIGIYGYSAARFRGHNISIWDTYGDGVRFTGGDQSSSSHASQWTNTLIYGTGGVGFNLGSFAYDTQVANMWIAYGTIGVSLSSGGQKFTNLHCWAQSEDCVQVRSNENRFENVYLEAAQAGKGIDAFEAENLKVSNGYIRNNSNQGILFQNSKYCQVVNCNIYNSGSDGVGITASCKSIMVSNCSIKANRQYGIQCQVSTTTPQDITITNNVIEFNGYRGIRGNANNLIIANNVIKNNGAQVDTSNMDRGIDVFAAVNDIIITGNRFFDDTDTTATTIASAATATDTTITVTDASTFEEGMNLYLEEGAINENVQIKTISGNVVTLWSAISNSYTTSATVTPTQTQNYGISFGSTADNSIITNNNARGSPTAGIIITSTGTNIDESHNIQ